MSDLVADVSGGGPAVVLLHGQPGSRGDWARLTRRLAPEFLVIAPDRPGYGDRGGRARGFRGNAAAVVSLLDHLEVERAIVVGYSWAGGVALALAQESRERLAGLVLVSSVCPGEPLGQLDKMLAVPPIGTAVTAASMYMANGILSLAPVRRTLQRRQHGGGGADEGTDGDGDSPLAPHEVVAEWVSNRAWQSFVTEQRCLVDELPLLAPGLAAITTPTVVLVGDADRMVPPGNGRQLARTIPGARLVELAGAGHLLAHQHPDEVAAAIRQIATPGD
jgi:pimeloyl-ACP methyl ester carboxylesterase